MMAFVVNVLCDFNYLLAALLNFLFCVLFLTLDTNKVLYFKFLVYAFVLAACDVQIAVTGVMSMTAK